METPTTISSINYNWYATESNGEELTNRTVGFSYGNVTCDKILEHRAAGEGDRWYYDIYYSDGSMHRVFNPNKVVYIESKKGGEE